jgi:hypothetical protein
MKENGEALLNQGIESYKKAFPSKKYKEEVLSSINMKKGLFSLGCDQLYKAGKFKDIFLLSKN